MSGHSQDRHFDWSLLPPRLRPAFERYIFEGRVPNEFLVAILANDLRRSITLADPGNLNHLRDTVLFLENQAPGRCWGSGEKIAVWEEIGGLNGIADALMDASIRKARRTA